MSFLFSQNVLLTHLGLAPMEDGPWPLTVSLRCLGILAMILLARQQKALSLGGPACMDTPECVQIWERFIDTLCDKATQRSDSANVRGNELV